MKSWVEVCLLYILFREKMVWVNSHDGILIAQNWIY